MLKLRDLETYLMVKDFMGENDINIEEPIRSINCKKIPVKITCDGITKKFYSVAFAARYMGVSLPMIYYAHNSNNEAVVRKEGGVKVFFLD